MLMTIGTLARGAKVHLQTLRYYERRGLLSPLRRATSGYRIYDEKSLSRLRFIRQAQKFGFSLKEIEGLLRLRPNYKSDCLKARTRAEEKVSQIRQKVESLENIYKTLGLLAMRCRKNSKGKPCPLLTRFYRGGVGP